MGVISDGTYGVQPGLVFSYPVRIEHGRYSIVENLIWNDWSTMMINRTQNELIDEKNNALESIRSERFASLPLQSKI
jgi:malate dehydrogenase